jgi:PIN domain-containing protein
MTTGLTLDAGALVAVERGDPRIRALLRSAVVRGLELHVVPGVVAQTWRGGSRRARLARLLNSRKVEVPVFDDADARAVGVLCRLSGHTDVVDAHVVLHARQADHKIVTVDPDALRRVDPSAKLIRI